MICTTCVALYIPSHTTSLIWFGLVIHLSKLHVMLSPVKSSHHHLFPSPVERCTYVCTHLFDGWVGLGLQKSEKLS